MINQNFLSLIGLIRVIDCYKLTRIRNVEFPSLPERSNGGMDHWTASDPPNLFG